MNLKKIILCGLLAITLSGCSFSFEGFSNFTPGPGAYSSSTQQTSTSTSESVTTSYSEKTSISQPAEIIDEELIKENYTYLRETRSYIASVTVEKEYGSRFLLYAQQGDVYLIEQLIFDANNESSQLVSYLCQLFQDDGQYKLFVERYIDGNPQENNVYTKGDGYYEWYGGNFAENNGIILDGFDQFQGFWNQENGFTYDYDGNVCYYKTPFGKNVAINAIGADLVLKYYEYDILHIVNIESIGQDIFGLNG
jgi:hypothetical protein